MTATAIAPAIPERPQRSALAWAASDTTTIAWRNLITLKRLPQLLIFATVQPVIFVLMFRYVFGGAIKVPGVPYVDYLMPGVFAQTVAFLASHDVQVEYVLPVRDLRQSEGQPGKSLVIALRDLPPRLCPPVEQGQLVAQH